MLLNNSYITTKNTTISNRAMALLWRIRCASYIDSVYRANLSKAITEKMYMELCKNLVFDILNIMSTKLKLFEIVILIIIFGL